MRLVAAIFGLMLTTVLACHPQQEKNERSPTTFAKQSQNQAPNTPPTVTPASPPVADERCLSQPEKYTIFDECKDFNPLDSLTVKDMRQRFPVLSSDAAFLRDGGEFFAARMHLLENAKRSVRIQSLTFTNDESSALIVNKLIELMKRKVKVSIIVDTVHNLSPDEQEMYYKLQKNGANIEGFQFLYLNFVDKVLRLDALGLTVGELNMRYHEKLFIIDGEYPEDGRAIIGGANIANRYFQVQHEEPEFMWRDRDVLLRGPIVKVMTESFDRNVAEKMEARKSNLISSSTFWWRLLAGFIKDEEPYDLSKRNKKILDRLQAYLTTDFVPSWQPVKIRFMQSRPRNREDLIHPLYISMIADSQKSIRILNSYFLPDESFILALQDAVRRGVKVEIITNHAKNTDFEQLTSLTRSYYIDLLQLNALYTEPRVYIYEWSGHSVLNNNEGQNHSKFAVFDDVVAIVGSYNIDPRSHKLNSESIVAFASESAVQPYANEFDLFAGEGFSVEVDLATAQEYEASRDLRDTLELRILEILKPFL